jgi:kelch-like protein 10
MMTQTLVYAKIKRVDINNDNVCELLVTSDYLCVEGVLELCCDFLNNTLDLENCIGIMRFAR